MSCDGSVTRWFEELEQGNSAAAQPLWERYFPELVRLAREKLRGTPAGAADEGLPSIAIAKMQGYSNREIANRLECSVRTIERRLELIRKQWTEE